ncbi:hypothetical protein VFPPC_17455 [Pochonia chlamydosporia 170]|uniref:Uncharacterized protein n=1 Tax=Pochonia chlamydosporia 170 TaxID=1380566 RepID=A0A219AR04_METCM|nr:hypothetical protein VFPPC_17455 [Pochonia chlamydosporia 170]OWT43208.1 hypothetical protein VFPPC_17455 [Pochonia chlamydosporia 170]
MSSDASSSIVSAAQTSAPATPLHFDVIFKVEYVGKPNTTLKSGVQRRKQFTCRQCNSWSTPHRTNAVKHVLSVHPLSRSSQSSVSAPIAQRDISSMFVPITSQNGLRNSFNQQAYREAIIGLLTRRRMPFSAVEWSEMKDMALACNPAIEDLLIRVVVDMIDTIRYDTISISMGDIVDIVDMNEHGPHDSNYPLTTVSS